jgi:hypothetical protein
MAKLVNPSAAVSAETSRAEAAEALLAPLANPTFTGVVAEAATNTSSGATYSNPSLSNSTTGTQLSASKDVMLYLTCSTAGTGLTIKMGTSQSPPQNTIVSNVAVSIGDMFTIRVPAGWYVAWNATTAAFANQAAVTC